MNDTASLKKRLITMIIVDAVAFLVAAVAMIGWVSGHIAILGPVFAVAIAVGIGAQIWFIVGFARMGKDAASKA